MLSETKLKDLLGSGPEGLSLDIPTLRTILVQVLQACFGIPTLKTILAQVLKACASVYKP